MPENDEKAFHDMEDWEFNEMLDDMSVMELIIMRDEAFTMDYCDSDRELSRRNEICRRIKEGGPALC